jgi:hypothetical protein
MTAWQVETDGAQIGKGGEVRHWSSLLTVIVRPGGAPL